MKFLYELTDLQREVRQRYREGMRPRWAIFTILVWTYTVRPAVAVAVLAFLAGAVLHVPELIAACFGSLFALLVFTLINFPACKAIINANPKN